MKLSRFPQVVKSQFNPYPIHIHTGITALQHCLAVHRVGSAPTMSLRMIAILQLCVRIATIAAAKPQVHLRHSQANAAAEPSSKLYPAPSEDPGGCSKGFAFRVKAYTPSNLEREWTETVAAGDEDACRFMLANSGRVKTWLSALEEVDVLSYNIHSRFTALAPNRRDLPLPSDIFSKYTLVNTCPGEFFGVERELMVEPLAGHLRHPYAVGACQPKGVAIEDPDIIGNLGHLRLSPWPAADLSLMYPGKKYLFDLGTSTFDSSLNYLTTRYRQAGVEFDSIWAWEVKTQDPITYWSSVPEAFMSRIHFYNVPVTDNFTHASHPLNIVRSICQPGDFIVIKLDIDVVTLEASIMAEIERSSKLRGCIAEITYEQHYNHPDVNPWFGDTGKGNSLKDVVENFSRLRKAGVVLHYWP